MISFSSLVSNQIRFSVNSLNNSNFDFIFRQLCQFVGYGCEGSILLLQTCLDLTMFHVGDVHKMQLRPDLLAAIFRYLLEQPNFSTVLCEAVRTTISSEQFLGDFCDALHLSVSEKIGVGLALADSENTDVRMIGKTFCINQIEDLSKDSAFVGSSEQVHNIIMFLHRSGGLVKHVDSFMQMLTSLEPKERTPFVLAPLCSLDLPEVKVSRNLESFYLCRENDFDAILAELETETSMADIMKELGYGCSTGAPHCNEVLSLFSPLTEAKVSGVLATIARTHTGLDDNENFYSSFCSAMGNSTTSETLCVGSWNVDVLVDSIKQLAPEINWILVMENLDQEVFYLPNEEAFILFMSVYAHACQDPFPLHAICGSVWKNADGQLSFLRYAVSAPPDIFTFAHSPRRLAHVDAFHGLEGPLGQANDAWFSLDLVEVLCQLAESGHAGSVRAILEFALKYCPEVLLLGIAQITTTYNLLQFELSSTILPVIVGNSMKSGMILHIWHSNPKLVLRGFIDMINADQGNVVMIFNVCQELKILPSLLEQMPFCYSIRFAALSCQRGYIILDKWLNDNLGTYKDVFFEACIKFLNEILFIAPEGVIANSSQHHGSVVNIYAETSPTFIKALEANMKLITSEKLSEELKMLHKASMIGGLRLQKASNSSTSNGHDIEAEAKSYFQQLFSGQMTTDAMVQMLSRFKDSSERREQLIFECMIEQLFYEYQYFSGYPDVQLNIAAVLVGSLVKHRLVTDLSLRIALRAVLDALRKPTDTKLFAFGTIALEQFLDRLVELPPYCNLLLQISHLHGAHPELVAFVERTLARIASSRLESNATSSASIDPRSGSTLVPLENMEVSDSGQLLGSTTTQAGQPLSSFQMQQRHQVFLGDRLRASGGTSTGYLKPLLPSSSIFSPSVSSQNAAVSSSGFLHSSRGVTSSSMLRQHSHTTGFGSALNIETLVAAAERRNTHIEAPSSDVQDKILFMINNISSTNIEAKANEFTQILSEEYYPWFAQYMVMKRASIEPNFHDMYLKFLDKVNSRALNKEIVKAAYENCKVLLRSDLIKSSSEERSLLKNLGSWLGKFTIGRNQVLRFREIDPKSLIIEAYEKGLMIAVIPFTSKILEPCHSSLAYRPPNPWTMAVLGLLVEIYALPNLKMNLKFDIEVLFKNLSVDMKEVKPTSLLKGRIREVEGNPDFSNKDFGASQPHMVAEINSGVMSTLNQVELQPEIVNPSQSGGHLNLLSQYSGNLHLASSPLMEDEKIAALSLSDRLPSGQGLSQVAPSQSPYSVSQLSSPIHDIGSQIKFNQKLSAMGLQYFQRVIPLAMERAVKEVMSPVVQRSVTIASQTTRELVMKDYATESDETRIYKAANLMVASLAGSLAHVTCKEPLRASISSQLRNSLQGLNTSNELQEQAIAIVLNDNLDLGCVVIEHAATEKALKTIDNEITKQLSLRRKHREAVGPSYYDPSVYAQGPMGVIPETLRPRPGHHPSYSQQRVYEDFVRFPWQSQSGQSSNAVPTGFSSAGLGATGLSGVAQPIDLVSEATDPNSAQLFRVSSLNGDDFIPHGAAKLIDIDSSVAAAASESHFLEASNAVKEMETDAVSLPSTSTTEHLGIGFPEPLLTTGDALEKYESAAHKLESFITKDTEEADLQGVIAQIPEILLKCISRDEAALAVAQKVFKSLYEDASNSLHVSAHLTILAAIRDVCKLVVKELTSWVVYSNEDKKFNIDITVGLIRKELLNLAEYNMHMAKLIDAGRNKAATEFSISLLQTLLVQESRPSVSELPNLVDALAKLATRPGSPESLHQLIEIAKNPSASPSSLSGLAAGRDDRAKQSLEKVSGCSTPSREDLMNAESGPAADPAGFRDQVSGLFAEWYQIYELHGTHDAACGNFISQLQQSGYLNGDDISEHFFRILTELSVEHCISTEGIGSRSLSLLSPQTSHNLSFLAIDVYAKLVVLILKYCVVEHGLSALLLLPKLLSVTVRVIQRDAEEKRASFNSRPYFRLFIDWIFDLLAPDPILDNAHFQVLVAFANAFRLLQPLRVPGFSFAWLELVSHRSFMPKLLTVNPPKGWPHVQRLLVDLFKFMEPYLRNAELGEPIHFLYKGTLRVLLVLLHDFPEFLCDYHFSFCDVIPSSCVQMRNVILSAFPRNMRLPDPSTPNLKIDLLAEITQSPHIFSDVDAALKAKQMKSDVDEYLKTRHEGLFSSELKQRLLLTQNESAQLGTRYNVPLINSLVLYVGMQTVQQIQIKAPPPLAQQLGHNGAMECIWGPAIDIFQLLLADLDTEGRYLFLNAIANQLRYPNNHTHFFSFVLLYLFVEASQEIIQEQITRVLLERLIVNRPHPWGLLITFIELIKNSKYNFWSRSFTRCAPEIEKLFESVARSCGGIKAMDESMMAAGLDSMR